jgi:membrane fusion protein, copper/silver efflux system
MKKTTAIGAFFVMALVAFLVGRYSGAPGDTGTASKKRILYYVDPMHPSFHADKPGLAPDCGMPLEPVYEGEGQTPEPQLPPGAVAISADRQQLYGVHVETVERNSGPRTIRTTGRVEADENRVYRLMAATEGWVQSLENNPTGTIVKRNELLATLYSREFRNAEQAYLGSLASLERVKANHETDDPSRMSDANLRINEEQLRALGMGEPQIRELAKSRHITRDITLNSPIDGIVLTRNLSPQQRFDKGAEFYRIGDLDKVWIIADVFGDEGQLFRPGAKVRVALRERSKTITATVSQNPPLFDPATRTLKLRLQADNPGLLLRPDMFVDLEFNVHAPAGLLIPQEAVLDSGMQKIVYAEASEGVFEPRPVETGEAYGNRIMVTRGLSAGDRIVTSGNFLVDSESRMRATPVFSSPVPQHAKQKGPGASNANSSAIDAQFAGKDPVCGMKLSDAQFQSTQHQETYRGETLHFCSDNCQKKFRKDPGHYAANNAAASSSRPDDRHEARR